MIEYDFDGRKKHAKILMNNAKWMQKNGYYFLVRGNQKFAGVILKEIWRFDNSSGKKKLVAIVLTPEGKIVEEDLMVWDDFENEYKPIFDEFGNFIRLTAKPSPEENENLLIWLPPADTKPITELKNYIQQLELSLNELENIRQRLEHKARLYENQLIHLEELNNTLQREQTMMSKELVALKSTVDALRRRQEEEHALVVAMKEQVNEFINHLIKVSQISGKEPFGITIEVMNNIGEIVKLIEKFSAGAVDRKSLEEKLANVVASIETMREKIGDLKAIGKKKEEGIIIEKLEGGGNKVA